MITYGYTIAYVENVEATIAFYGRAFGFTQKFITPEKDYGELETGGTTLAFASYTIAEYNGIAIEKRDSKALPSPFEITFVVDDIESAWKQAVEAGSIVVKEPVQKPWGQTVGYLRDINGFLMEVCTAVKTEESFDEMVGVDLPKADKSLYPLGIFLLSIFFGLVGILSSRTFCRLVCDTMHVCNPPFWFKELIRLVEFREKNYESH